MPIYEYRCGTCEDDFEVLVFGKDEVLCPTCGGCVERLMSSCSFKSASGDFKTSGTGKSGCGSRAMATRPRILLLDEPFSGLSPREAERISRMILDLNHRGLTVLIIEHRLRELMKLVQKVMVIYFGEKIAEGTPEAIIRDSRVIQAYLGERSPEIGLA